MIKEKIKVNDRWIFKFIYPAFGISIVHIGNDNTFKQLLQIPSYYTDILLALICTYLLGFYYRVLFAWLDLKFNWDTDMKQRLTYQLFAGVFAPTFLVIGIEAIYLLVIGIKLAESSILYLELPVIIMFCVLINLIYLILYYRAFTLVENQNVSEQTLYKENFVAQLGSKSLNIALNDVAYFLIQDKLTFLVTTDGKKYVYDAVFKEIIISISPFDFFQLNRQVIAKRSSIIKATPTDTRRLEITLYPETDQPVYVAKPKASKFMTWLADK